MNAYEVDKIELQLFWILMCQCDIYGEMFIRALDSDILELLHSEVVFGWRLQLQTA